jgi:hypothetical protein
MSTPRWSRTVGPSARKAMIRFAAPHLGHSSGNTSSIIALYAAGPASLPVAGPEAGAQMMAMLEHKDISDFAAQQISRVQPGTLHFRLHRQF